MEDTWTRHSSPFKLGLGSPRYAGGVTAISPGCGATPGPDPIIKPTPEGLKRSKTEPTITTADGIQRSPRVSGPAVGSLFRAVLC
jgi:hypothetical protein